MFVCFQSSRSADAIIPTSKSHVSTVTQFCWTMVFSKHFHDTLCNIVIFLNKLLLTRKVAVEQNVAVNSIVCSDLATNVTF